MIPDDLIEQVRDAADVVTIIGESVQLRRTGADWRGPCPFHGGTHRNFAVIPRKGLFYCYVCHEAGDVFSYLMKRFGMDYPSAVREVARRVGIVIPDRPQRAGPDPHEPLYAAVAAAQDWFARQLLESPQGEAARRYLQGRDLSLDDVAPLGLGYAPPGREFLAAMTSLGVAEDTLVQAGLVVRREDGSVGPRFRDRLLFPIHDLRGRVVAFGGRLLRDGEPKYLNSPETPIFHKGSQLYNLHHARHAIRKAGHALLVEGYFDVLRLVLAGVEQVVAPLGTAFTGEQAALIRRYAPEAILVYDSDKAGLRATFRAADELLRHELAVRVVTLPPGEDPDTLVRQGGADAITPFLQDAVDVLERKLQLIERRGMLSTIEGQREAIDRLLPTVRAAANPITRDLYVTKVASRIGVSRDVLLGELQRVVSAPLAPSAPGGPSGAPRQPVRAEPARARRGERLELELLRILANLPEWRDRARSEVAPAWFEIPGHEPFLRWLLADGEPAARVEALDPAGRALWQRLTADPAALEEQAVDQAYAELCEILAARPHFRALDDQRDPQARRELRRELEQRFPRAWARRQSAAF